MVSVLSFKFEPEILGGSITVLLNLWFVVCLFVCLFIFETQSYSVAYAGLELEILMPVFPFL